MGGWVHGGGCAAEPSPCHRLRTACCAVPGQGGVAGQQLGAAHFTAMRAVQALLGPALFLTARTPLLCLWWLQAELKAVCGRDASITAQLQQEAAKLMALPA